MSVFEIYLKNLERDVDATATFDNEKRSVTIKNGSKWADDRYATKSIYQKTRETRNKLVEDGYVKENIFVKDYTVMPENDGNGSALSESSNIILNNHGGDNWKEKETNTPAKNFKKGNINNKTQLEDFSENGNNENSNFDLKNYPKILENSKNIIFRGAPGTGKSYLAKALAAYVISGGSKIEYVKLTPEEQKRMEFVQFHPSYDYSDFVEGLRPIKNDKCELGFELKEGVFKAFCKEAKKPENSDKKYVFIIDEINRGEISKIFGELFFSIDPGYRGRTGEVSTQYSNLHNKLEGKFYVPENVYIIGTMNDIDRSVDTFDFAMRRRFRFIEIDANENTSMLDVLGEDKKATTLVKMKALNNVIEEKLNKNYQIGAAYFKKLEKINFEELWADFLSPLLQEYVTGMYDEKAIMEEFENAYKS